MREKIDRDFRCSRRLESSLLNREKLETIADGAVNRNLPLNSGLWTVRSDSSQRIAMGQQDATANSV